MVPKNKKNNTSWGKVADWYQDYLESSDTYQNKVILPNVLRILAPQKGERILDLACGQGFFTREIIKSGATVIGADISKELIDKARKNAPRVAFYVASANRLSFARNQEFDAVFSVLALQNMDDLHKVFHEVSRVLKPSGKFLMVINHPTFRVLKRSSWGWDEAQKIQYRRIDGYLSSAKIEIDMHPGGNLIKKTISYHRSLQDFFKALTNNGFLVSRLEEWESHKTSGKGPREKAENQARKEIPLFMAIEAKKL